MDKLLVMQQLAMDEKYPAHLFKFIADPPTTSLQRLKGLTTGSLPTFIDVGNSFGAPAIVEDNLIHQLVARGKKVLMMGDDTWLHVFPTHFNETYPFPSFNVKDLHTVDEGVIKHLFPALHRDDWDVLIGHFLGMDHVGHIFGVESPHMVDKLEQYNRVIKEVVSVLWNESQPGGLHEDTLLLVMGDHGQTLNGDHGGGTAEEVETALFAMSTKHPPESITTYLNSLKCELAFNKTGKFCINKFPQLDFAVTLAALVGVPFPFGSIGRVNPELFALVSGQWSSTTASLDDQNLDDLLLLEWMERYIRVLCLNSWQVNRYFELYSQLALSAFPTAELMNVHRLYTIAQSLATGCYDRAHKAEATVSCNEKRAMLAQQIDAFSRYLDFAADLARSKWTKFSDSMMGFGLILFSAAAAVHLVALCRANLFCEKHDKDYHQLLPFILMLKGSLLTALIAGSVFQIMYMVPMSMKGASYVVNPLTFNHLVIGVSGSLVLGSAVMYILPTGLSTPRMFNCQKAMIDLMEVFVSKLDSRAMIALFFVAVHACSLLSNSFILAEGQVVNFLLASFGIIELRHALQTKSKVFQVLIFLGCNAILGAINHMSILKETPAFKKTQVWQLVSTTITAVIPFSILEWFVVQHLWRSNSSLWKKNGLWIIRVGVPLTVLFVLLHWFVEDLEVTKLVIFSEPIRDFARLHLPRLIYLMTTMETGVLIFSIAAARYRSEMTEIQELLPDTVIPLLVIWSSLILLLLGRHGPLIALFALIQGWCLFDMQSAYLPSGTPAGEANLWCYCPPTIQWILFSVQLFFCSGHKCTFDGLRYPAAFIGFDHFNFYRQGALLAVDTFGASHVLPILGIPLMVSYRPWSSSSVDDSADKFYRREMSQTFLLYGMGRLITTIMTTLCVTIQRRHLMVWGLFAPKFVFDVVGLLVTDVLLIFVALYSFIVY